MINQKNVTIIIPHLGGTIEAERAMDECWKSLVDTTKSRILIATNGRKCEKHVSMVDIMDQGQCKAVNAAVATVNTPWIFITNDDMVYAPGWWEALTDEAGIFAGCISPQLVEPRPGAPTFEVKFFGGAGGDFNKEGWLEYAKNNMDKGVLRTGFNFPLLIKKELWDLVGGYDVNYDPWGSNSDSDLEYKIKLAGVQPVQNTFCKVYHFSQTSGTFEPRNDSYRFKNYAYFKEKWGFDRTDEGIWEANFDIPELPERIFTPHWENFYGEKEPVLRGMRLDETYGE